MGVKSNVGFTKRASSFGFSLMINQTARPFWTGGTSDDFFSVLKALEAGDNKDGSIFEGEGFRRNVWSNDNFFSQIF